MNCVAQVVKSVGPKLVPFFKTLAIYFVVFIPHDTPSILATILKCLPVISLMLFVVLHGMNLGDKYRYSRRIFIGLIFCCIGDACLIWPNYFEIGMVSFTIGHMNYISAFAFKPLNLPLGICVFALNILGVMYLMPGLHGILIPGVPLYTFALTMMLWRALARVQLTEELWTWSKLSSAIGATLFVISDFVIGVDKFKFPVNHAQAVIMSTYYAAQLGIALSIVDATPQVLPEKKIKNEESSKSIKQS